MMSTNAPHIPIMVDPILDLLRVADTPHAQWIDGTLGAGGHSHAILSARDDSRLLGLDLDPQALAIAQNRLDPFGERVSLRHASYEQLAEHAQIAFDSPQVDGILLDLGISSMQIDSAERGFAFRLDGDLDMRFDPTRGGITAADIVNTYAQRELADLIFAYGEERDSRRIAQAIIQNRPFYKTTALADAIASASRTPAFKQKIHPATRTFQALRIAVNDELGAVERVIPQAIQQLKSGGRLAVITFHSLEDRIVKQAFKLAATDCICPPQQPVCTCDHHASVTLVTRKPVVAEAAEVQNNPRARSAKLRVVEKKHD